MSVIYAYDGGFDVETETATGELARDFYPELATWSGTSHWATHYLVEWPGLVNSWGTLQRMVQVMSDECHRAVVTPAVL